jgi:hypothetical protein
MTSTIGFECPNCGAQVVLLLGEKRFHCEYCGSEGSVDANKIKPLVSQSSQNDSTKADHTTQKIALESQLDALIQQRSKIQTEMGVKEREMREMEKREVYNLGQGSSTWFITLIGVALFCFAFAALAVFSGSNDTRSIAVPCAGFLFILAIVVFIIGTNMGKRSDKNRRQKVATIHSKYNQQIENMVFSSQEKMKELDLQIERINREKQELETSL